MDVTPSNDQRALPNDPPHKVKPAPIRTEFLFTLTGSVGSPFEVGTLPQGQRRIIPISGGVFQGPKLRGSVLPMGGDWMSVRPDGVAVVDVRATLETDDGELIYMRYGGYRHGPPEVMASLSRGEPVDPSEYYFRISPVFETSASRYSWLNRIVAVGTGRRIAAGPVYDVYEVL